MNNQQADKKVEKLLVIRSQAGDEVAFGLLVKRHHQRLLRHAIRVVNDYNDAQDVVQEAWINISKNLYRLDNANHFGPWAMKIVYFRAIDFIRKQKKKVTEWTAPEKDNAQEEVIQEILKGLNELPDNHKLILSLFYLEEMPIAEIAYILDLPPGTVKSRLYHAREYFKKQLKVNSHEK